MTLPIRINADGSRTYSNGYTYHPVKPEDRKYQGRKYLGEEGEYFGNAVWLPPFVGLLDESTRKMPNTVPDYEAYLHPYGCSCRFCRRPTSLWWKQKKRPGFICAEQYLVRAAVQSRKLARLLAAETAE